MVKLLQWRFGEISKSNAVIFLPMSILSLPFMVILTGLGEVFPFNFYLLIAFHALFTFVSIFLSLFHIISVLIMHFFLFLSIFNVIFSLIMHTSIFLFLFLLLFLFISLFHIISFLLMYLPLFLYLFHIIFVLLVHFFLFLFLSIFHIPLVYIKVFLVVTHIRT